MADATPIEWTDATWNPVTGCTKISPGCANCYAERLAERFRGTVGHPFASGFDLVLRPERLDQPLRWRRPRMIFVNSMSDLFHKHVPSAFVDRVFDTMEQADWHVYQILTKRSSRMRDYVRERYGGSLPPNHVWLGVSVEDNARLSRVEHLRNTPAAVRFISLEPLIGPVDALKLDGISWVIVGGESGPRARPMNPDWARTVRDRCVTASVPFFFKQWGGTRPSSGGRVLDGAVWSQWPGAPSNAAAQGKAGQTKILVKRVASNGSTQDRHLDA
jgi:protein gp37